MRHPEPEEPGSAAYNARLWRRDKMEQLWAATLPLAQQASESRWDEVIVGWQNERAPTQIRFASFDRHVVASDEHGWVGVQDWQRNVRLKRFHVEGGAAFLRGSRIQPHRITALHLINEGESAAILTGSSDGVIRVHRNYDAGGEVELATSFRALTDLIPSTHLDSGLVTDWQQARGHLLASGNVQSIVVWDAGRDVHAQSIRTWSESNVTGLASEQVAGHLVVAGFGDGTVKVYDRRVSSRDPAQLARIYPGPHGSWIHTVHLQRGGTRELVSGSLDGTVCTWDMRMDEPLSSFPTHTDGLLAMAIHDQAPVIATGSTKEVIKGAQCGQG